MAAMRTRVLMVLTSPSDRSANDRIGPCVERQGALRSMVTKRTYPGMGHAINEDEIRQTSSLLATFATGAEPNDSDPSTTQLGT
jgi:hypothetical protein